MLKILSIILLACSVSLANVPSEATLSRGTCDGAETDFAFSFKIGDDSELKVILRTIANGAEQVLTEDTHYTVSVPNNDYTNMTGGTITTISAPTGFNHPFGSAYEIVMYWQPSSTQTYQPSRSSTINRRSLENALDKIHRYLQYLSAFDKSTIHLPISDVNNLSDLELDPSGAPGFVYLNSSRRPSIQASTDATLTTYWNNVVTNDNGDHTATVSVTGPTNNVDVEFKSVVLVDTSSNSVTIGGFTGGTAGQPLIVLKTSAANTMTLENQEGTGNQDMKLASGADQSYTDLYDRAFLVYDGTNWIQDATIGNMEVIPGEDRLTAWLGSSGEISGAGSQSFIKGFTIQFDPGAAYDSSIYVSGPKVDSRRYPDGIIIDGWDGSFSNNPDVELDADLCYAARRQDYADPNVIDAIDTTDGLSSEDTDANINSGSVIPAGVYIYIRMNADPEGTGTNYTIDVAFHGVKS